MKYFYPFIVALMFLSFIIYGLWNSEQLQQKEIIQSSQTVLNDLQDSIRALKNNVATLQDSVKIILAKEPKLDHQMQINNLEKKVDTYQKLVSDTTNNMHEEMDDWLVILSIVITVIVALLGVVVPLIINYRNEKHLEKMLENSNVNANKAIRQAEDAQIALSRAQEDLETIQSKIDNAKSQATDAAVEATSAKNSLIGIRTKVDKTANEAKDAAKKAKAVQYFVQALQESDENWSIELYNKCINEDNQFAEAYNNRGFLRHRIGGPDASKKAMEDYTTAIVLFEKQNRGIYAEAYNNRGILHIENQELDEAEKNFDTAILKEYAEAYLNRGLLKYMNGYEYEAKDDFDIAITKKSNFSEAYYIRGLWEYCDYEEDDAINDIIKAKAIKNDVVEVYPNRSFFTGEMKDLDNSFNGVGFSNDMKKLISVPKEKKEPFIILNCVTEIGHEAFDGCANLTSIEIPSGVTEIGSYAFSGCTKLTSIKIPNSVTKIGRGAFAYCINIKEIIVDEDNPSYCSIDGVLYTLDMSQLIAVPGGIVSLVIPDGVNKVGPSSFTGCTSLNSIKIPESVTKIGAYAFRDCTSLTSVEIPDSVTEIGPSAFSRCDNLTEIHLRHKNPNVLKGLLYRPILSKVTLYVPKGSGKAYRKHGFYMKFKEIIEE